MVVLAHVQESCRVVPALADPTRLSFESFVLGSRHQQFYSEPGNGMRTAVQVRSLPGIICGLKLGNVLRKSVQKTRATDFEPDSIAEKFLNPLVPCLDNRLSDPRLLLGVLVIPLRDRKQRRFYELLKITY